MQFANLYARTAVLAALILAAIACQTAQKPVSLLPPTSAPSLQPEVRRAPPASGTTVASTAQEQDAPVQKSAAPETTSPATGSGSSRNAEQSSVSASNPASDTVAELIGRAEKEYQTGLANHKAGKTEEAKQNFDDALNSLLSSRRAPAGGI
jgi:hypothetical protein